MPPSRNGRGNGNGNGSRSGAGGAGTSRTDSSPPQGGCLECGRYTSCCYNIRKMRVRRACVEGHRVGVGYLCDWFRSLGGRAQGAGNRGPAPTLSSAVVVVVVVACVVFGGGDDIM